MSNIQYNLNNSNSLKTTLKNLILINSQIQITDPVNHQIVFERYPMNIVLFYDSHFYLTIIQYWDYNMKNMNLNIGTLRQKIHHQIRREQIQQKFKQSRKQLELINKKQTTNIFNLLSHLDQNNYKQCKQILRMYSYDNDYNFNILSAVGIVYEYLLENPYDFDSIEILRSVCQYQEIQVPQTQQLAELLTLWISYKGNTEINKAGLEIASVLVRMHRYEELLRDLLIDYNIIKLLQNIIHQQITNKKNTNSQSVIKFKQNYVVLLVTDILGSFVSSLNILQLQRYQQCIILLSKACQFHQIKWIVGNMFTEINSKYKQNYQIAQIINQNMYIFVQIHYYSIAQDCISLFMYSIRSQYPLSDLFLQFMLKTISSDSNTSIRKAALFCILYGIEGQQIESSIKQMNIGLLQKNEQFLQKMIKAFLQNYENHQDCISIIHKVLMHQNNLVSDLSFGEQQLIQLVHQCLISMNIKMIIDCLEILTLLISASEQKEQKRQNLIQMIQNNLQEDFYNLMKNKNVEICSKMQILFDLLNSKS